MDLYQQQNVYTMTQAMSNGNQIAMGPVQSTAVGPEQPIPSTSFEQSQVGYKPVMPVAPIVQSNPGMLPVSPFSQARGQYPVQNARGTYGTPGRQQPQQQYEQPCSSPVINRRKLDRIQQWNAEHHRITHLRQGYSSASRASSVASAMSGMSGMSRLSNVSQFSALSISTDMTDLPNPAQMQRSNQYSSTSSTASYAENIDPTCSQYFLGIQNNVDEVTAKIQETLRSRNFCGTFHEESLRRISRKVYTLIDQYDLTHLPHEKLKFFLTSILILIDSTPDDQEIKRVLLAAVYTFSTKPLISRILKEIFLENPERVILIFAKRFNCQLIKYDFCNYIAVILHTLLFYAKEKGVRFDFAKKAEMMKQVLSMLCVFTEPKIDHRLGERSKRIIIDISRLLVFKDDNLKKFFAEKGGIEIMLWFLRNEPSEEVMHYAAHSIRTMLNCRYKEISEKCVAARGVQFFADKLSHGSPRLLVECSACLTALSDVESLREDDLSVQLWQVLQILGSTDPELIKNSLAFLGNVSASNRGRTINPNKEYLVSNRGVESIINVLRYYIPQQDSELRIYEVIENGIFTLKNLTSSNSLGKKRDLARKQLVELDGGLNILLELLILPVVFDRRTQHLFHISSIRVGNRIDLLLIIQRLIDSSYLDYLFNAHSFDGTNFVAVLLQVLFESAKLKDTCSIEPQRTNLVRTIDSVLGILEKIVESPKFHLQIQPLIRESKFTEVLRTGTSVEVSYVFLRAIEIMVHDQQTRDEWRKDYTFLAIMQFYVTHQQPEFANVAQKIMATIEGVISLQFADMIDDDIGMSFH